MVCYIFVFRGRFPFFEVSNFLVIGGVDSFLVVFLRPLIFWVSQKNEDLLT